MKSITRNNLDKVATTRPPGYVEEVLAVATVGPDGILQISDEDFMRLHAMIPLKPVFAPKDMPVGPVPAPTLPSLTTMAGNLVGAVAKEAAAIAAGAPAATDEDIEARMVICRTCEFYIQDKERCSKCGCFMRAKSRLRSAKCPEGKW